MAKFNRREFLKQTGTLPFCAAFLAGTTGAAPMVNVSPKMVDPWLEINLDNMAWNLSQIRKRVHPRPVMAVIKANAYGHGLVEVAKFLEKQHIRFMAVGKLQEAFALREKGIQTPILNFGPISSGEAKQVAALNISQSVYTDDVAVLSRAAFKLKRRARVHIKVDTGLGRVGIPYYLALPYIKKVALLPNIIIEGIFTTFTEDEEFDKIQLQRFLHLCDSAKKQGINVGLRHAVSSAGVLSFPSAYLDMVRPGITLYGHYPSDKEYRERKIDLKPALSLKARVIHVKKLRPGDSVSYHRKFTAKNETPVVTLPVGYSDGYPYQVAGKAEVVIHGRRWPVIAAVTANHSTLDISGADRVNIGDEAVLIGRQGESEVRAEEIASWADTSVYKIVIGMNPLLPRIYLDEG
ncbi:MAG: alanine racemase [Candidatus Aminicenantes bacterium]|nr:alanine racemase [Candidatus Aminicenantes bacterium]NIM81820.1 alanine racemase [Candidatus Aminicenantes bacterium]NIN21193.1 alanine racemase [Candidatus Aminicenantes bacterium]NIN45017.1 alanine racemase [Candidatus Aminicenantes bacterium]NIN87835.1 alanine racemase [Candidatus Aminicenantes bacterium]